MTARRRSPALCVLLSGSVGFAVLVSATGCLSAPGDQATDECTECEDPGLLTQPGEYRIDTTTGVMTRPDGTEIELPHAVTASEIPVFVMEVERLLIGPDTTLRTVGIRPIEMAVAGEVQIDGVLDASTRAGDVPGAGAHTGSCSPQVDADEDNNASESAGGGGGGGSLSYHGGGGATGDAGAAAGASTGTIPAWTGALRGGCAGGVGAISRSSEVDVSAAGGGGGGGIRIRADGAVLVSGHIDAGGGGGAGGRMAASGGGGGGGSGGIVWIETPELTIAVDGSVSAKGGGGGEGGSACFDGVAGTDGFGLVVEQPAGGSTLTGDCEAADTGGLGGGDGGGGSQGNFSGSDDGEPGDAGEGGGGGGGSPGFVIVSAGLFSALDDATSPPPVAPDELE